MHTNPIEPLSKSVISDTQQSAERHIRPIEIHKEKDLFSDINSSFNLYGLMKYLQLKGLH